MYGCAMGFGWIVSLLFVGVLIYLFTQKSTRGTTEKSAQDILDERYAKGEIEEKEYREKSEQLMRH